MAIHDFALILRADPQIDYNRHFTITQPSLDRLTSLFKETVEVVVRSKEEISGALERFKDRNIDLLYLGGHGRYDGKAIRLSPNCYLEDKDLERSWFDNVSKVVLHACRVGENFAKQICDITDKPISIIGSTDDIYNMKVNVFNREFPIIFSNRPEAFDNPFLQFFNNSTFIATNDKLLDDYIEKKVDLLRYVKNKEMEKTIKSFKVMSDYFFSRYMSVEEAQENLEIAENILEFFYENGKLEKACIHLIEFVNLILAMQVHDNEELDVQCRELIRNKQSEVLKKIFERKIDEGEMPGEDKDSSIFGLLDGYLHVGDIENSARIVLALSCEQLLRVVNNYDKSGKAHGFSRGMRASFFLAFCSLIC